MHKSSILRMKWFVDNYISKMPFDDINILDVGSYDVNGSYKHLFSEDRFNYKGLDMEEGPNVDIVLKNPYDWDALATDQFEVIISGQAFEHTEFFWITMSEMTRVLKKDGLLCIIAPNGFVEHRYPVDCYRFFTDGMTALARYVGLEILHAHTNSSPDVNNTDWYSDSEADSILIAKKYYKGKTQHPDLQNYQCIPGNQERMRGNFVPQPAKANPMPEKTGLKRLWQKLTTS